MISDGISEDWRKDVERRLDKIERKQDREETRTDSLVAFRSWVLGGAAGLGMLVGFFADLIKKKLGL